MSDEIEELRAQAEALGVTVDGRWGTDRLRSEIEAAQPDPADDEPADDDATGDEPADDDATDDEPAAYRAGGYVNSGDGWVLEA